MSLRQVAFALPVAVGLLIIVLPVSGGWEAAGVLLITIGAAWWALHHVHCRYRAMRWGDTTEHDERFDQLTDSMSRNVDDARDLARDLRAARMRVMDEEWRLRSRQEGRQQDTTQ